MMLPKLIVDRLLESEEFDPKDYALRHGDVLPAILTTEDCVFLTDRWGEPTDDYKAEQVEPFIPLMGGMENSFVVNRKGKLGILFEEEVLHPEGDDPQDNVQDAWNGEVPSDVGYHLRLRAYSLQVRHPSVEFYVTVGQHIVASRYAVRAFGERPEDPHQIGDDLHAQTYG